jgi:myo-inositol 2-dehydrogenase/D-chiro-inositol 1-dehydrogenase
VITQTLAAFEHHQIVKITGTRGALWAEWHGAMDRDEHPRFSLRAFDGQRVTDLVVEHPAGELFELEAEIAAVAASVRAGKPLPASGIDGTRAVSLCQAAHESVNRGVPVSWARP